MKFISTLSLLSLGMLFTINASAEQLSTNIDGKELIGIVSVSNAYSLDNVVNELNRKAVDKGATSIKILSAGGKNKLQGVAEIYK